MLALGRYLSKLALTFWLGEMLFFVIIFAPRVFKVLPRDMAGQLQGEIFPAYYTAGLIAAILFAVGLVLRCIFQDPTLPLGRTFSVAIALAIMAAVVFLYSKLSLTPEINALRPLIHQDAGQAARFATLHRLSVQVNGVALLCLLVLLALV